MSSQILSSLSSQNSKPENAFGKSANYQKNCSGPHGAQRVKHNSEKQKQKRDDVLHDAGLLPEQIQWDVVMVFHWN